MPNPPRRLSAAFEVAKQPIIDPEPEASKALAVPKATPIAQRPDPRANRQAFTTWLDRDLIADLKGLSRDLVAEKGRSGNSIEALLTKAIEGILREHKRR